ncbi:MAG TPA: DUF72 domain-containing protein, partial [Nitrospira sp.]|nr:DUF72 domain-containing protein [Nitrospira sp.]
YPPDLPDRDRLSYYATQFDTVEIDSTFYGTPSATTVRNWASKVSTGFVFAVKVWQEITHQKCLRDCDKELTDFVKTMDLLGEKLGPMLLQLPFFNRSIFKDQSEFLDRLREFLPTLPRDHRFALEIRNPDWLDARLADLLREYGLALVLQDQSWMPRPTEVFARFDPITANFTYARLLGGRKGIETVTKTWDRVVVGRSAELSEWHGILTTVRKRGIEEFVYINNHYSGCGHITARTFLNMFGVEAPKPRTSITQISTEAQGKLF